MRRKIWLIVVVLLFLGWQWWSRQPVAERPDAGPVASTPGLPGGDARDRAGPARHDVAWPAPSSPTGATPADVAEADGLPTEARDTLRLIERGGPFPYERDGAVFGNFEHRLPARPRGYYHEYTVPTPGAHNRGARRIIAGGQPPEQFWYTDDHYESFRALGGRP
jgi:guanyl-specific ribonuclease Sa